MHGTPWAAQRSKDACGGRQELGQRTGIAMGLGEDEEG